MSFTLQQFTNLWVFHRGMRLCVCQKLCCVGCSYSGSSFPLTAAAYLPPLGVKTSLLSALNLKLLSQQMSLQPGKGLMGKRGGSGFRPLNCI